MKRQWPLILVALATIAIGSGWLWWQEMRRQLDVPLVLTAPQLITVEPGTSLRGLAADLAERGWMARPWVLVVEGRRRGIARSIRAGEYEVTPGMTPLGLLEAVVAGRVVQHQLTLVEGWTFERIMEAVEQSVVLVHTLETRDPRRVMAELGYAGYFAEGRFFPDTYRFPRGTTDVEFLRRAVRTMEEVLAGEWPQRAVGLSYESPYQALIMASLVEAETAVPSERPRIAGVFTRRLARGMRLQTDPTVIYALGASYDGNIRRDDLAIDSPYNTYVYAGLPPTPIGSPGRDSIRAALQPEEGEALYFVARGDGSHEFSATLAEHNRAVQKYQLRKGKGARGD
jgi:UPF0755 protein